MLGYIEVRDRNAVVLYNLILNMVILLKKTNIITLEITVEHNNQVLSCVNYVIEF